MANLQYLTQQQITAAYARLRNGYMRPAWMGKVMTILEGHDAKAPWISGVASGMEEFDPSGKTTEKPVAQYIEMLVKKFKAGVEVPLEAMRRDLTNSLSRDAILGDLADRDMEHFEELFMDALIAGATATAYDGQLFFGTDHSDAGGSFTDDQSNKINSNISDIPVANHGTTTAPSIQEFMWSVMAGIQQMQSFKDSMGNYVNKRVKSVAVFCSSSMYTQAMAINKLNEEYGGSNTLAEIEKKTGLSIDIIADPYLSAWTNKFVVVRTDVRRTLALGLEEELEGELALSVKSPANSDYCADHEVFTVKRRANRVVKLGDWRYSVQVTLT